MRNDMILIYIKCDKNAHYYPRLTTGKQTNKNQINTNKKLKEK